MTWHRQSGSNPIYRTATHRQAREQLLKAYRPGDPCCLCGGPMWPPTSQLHADHHPGTGEYRGLAHATCNRSDGARRGNLVANMTKIIGWVRPTTAARW